MKESLDEKDSKMRVIGLRIVDNPFLLLQLDQEQIRWICIDSCHILGNENDDFLKSIYMTILYHIAFREDISLEECWQIFWNLTRVTFVNPRLRFLGRDGSLKDRMSEKKDGIRQSGSMAENDDLDYAITDENALKRIKASENYVRLSAVYSYIYDFVESNIDFSRMPYRNAKERNEDRIVLVTSQFLNIGHAPTQRVLDYAYILQHELKKKVIIINDGGMHFYRNEHLGGVAAFNFLEEYNDLESFEYKGEVLGFIQIPQLMPNLPTLQEACEMIYELNPGLVFNVGGSSLLTDLCTKFVMTSSMPCRVEYPVSRSEYLLVARSVSADEPEYRTKQAYQKVIETNFNYIYRKSDKVYSRREFGIPEDAFLCMMVGYRIGQETDTAFLDLLRKAYYSFSDEQDLQTNVGEDFQTTVADAETFFKDYYFVFVGVVEEEDRKRILDSFPVQMQEKVVFTGLLKDASEFIRLGNLFLNPDRNGGGRAAFESLHFGIPVVTFRNGDVYYVAGDEFGAENYDEYADIIRRYFSDKSFYKEKSEKASARAKILEDMTGTLRKVLNDITK